MTAIIPRPQSPIAAPSGHPTREWYNFLRQLAGLDGDGLQDEISELAARVAALEDGQSFVFEGAMSIRVSNIDGTITVSLEGDNDSPGGNWYYGTNAEGLRGFWPIADGVGVGTGLTKAVDYGPYNFQGELDTPADLPYPVVVDDAYLIDGSLWVGVDDEDDGPAWDNTGPSGAIVVLSLEELPNSNEGQSPLQLITRDAYGRVEGTEDAGLDDLADVDAGSPADGDALVWNAGTDSWEPGQVATEQPFNYISADGDPYVTEDGVDLYIGA